VTNGLIRRISSGLMTCIRKPMLAATPSTRLKWSSSSWLVANRMPPVACQPVASPVIDSSLAYRSLLKAWTLARL
jgi:hypothetical protein